jgi:hypothetical protein
MKGGCHVAKARFSEVALTPVEAARMREVATRLERLLDASARFLAEAAEPPVPNSPMDRANKAELSDPYQQGFLLIWSAEDHLRTILLVLKTGPLPGFALYTLLRAAAEADVRAKEMLDPMLTETQRLARALNERLGNLEEARKVDPTQNSQKYDQRVAHLENRARANGITPIPRRTKAGTAGPTHAFDERRKSVSELFTLWLPAGSIAYQYLCGYTHSMMWAQLAINRAEPSADPKIALVPTDLNVQLFADLLTIVLDLHDRNVGHWLTLAGYPHDVWTNAKKGPS